jgi:hypothetical protein
MSDHVPISGELFIVDNSESEWKGLRYLQEWTEIARAFDIAGRVPHLNEHLAISSLYIVEEDVSA